MQYSDTYQCEKYLQLHAKPEDTQGKRAAWDLAAVSGVSGLNNTADNEEFRKIQYAYHDCQMMAMAFFLQKKSLANNVSVENENQCGK